MGSETISTGATMVSRFSPVPFFTYSSLVKMLYWMCEKTLSDPTNKQLEHAIKRNFGDTRKCPFEIIQVEHSST